MLSGTCVVNEAMLTGEAVPQMKEPSPSELPASATLNAAHNPRMHIIFGGTEVVQAIPPTIDSTGLRLVIFAFST